MSYNPKVEIDKPKRSNHDLSHINRFSAAPGLEIPCLTRDVYPGDDIRLGISSLIKTLPLLGPLMGSAKVQFDTFFIPNRLYCKPLHDDRVSFDPAKVWFPQLYLGVASGQSPVPGQNDQVHTSSLLHYLDVPEKWSGRDYDTHRYEPVRYINAVPFLGYWDIYRGYYANTQVGNGYVCGQPTVSGDLQLDVFPLSQIDLMKEHLLTSDTQKVLLPNDPDYIPYNPSLAHYPNGGLGVRTHLPDRFNVWVDQSRYSDTLSQAVVDVTSGKLDIDAFRFAVKLNRMVQKTLVSGGRYSDWQEVQYGVRLRGLNEVPTFIGSVSTELTFEDVVQTSDSSDSSSPLGSLGGRGVGFMQNRLLRYYVPESGFLMTLVSIIPRVDYYQGMPKYYRFNRLSDLHVPEMDAIGYQDLLVDEINSSRVFFHDDAEIDVDYSVGKQPAWSELMSAVNRIHGDFADPDKLMYMTFAQRYSEDNLGSLPNDINSYIDPKLFNQNFADSSQIAHNFWLQVRFDFRVNRAISKRLMPSP